LTLLLPLALTATGATAQAQAPRPVSRPDPLDARAQVPPLRHESAFASYRATADSTPTPWAQANDTVARIGGWRAYAREAQAPAPAASGAPGKTPR
jgi:hypothetical protein